MGLKVLHCTTEISLKRWDQQCTNHTRRSRRNQEETKVAEQAALEMLGDIKFYALGYEWPLKGVRRSETRAMIPNRENDTAIRRVRRPAIRTA
jgi:hypothetical protein